jgi:hypothetical protein
LSIDILKLASVCLFLISESKPCRIFSGSECVSLSPGGISPTTRLVQPEMMPGDYRLPVSSMAYVATAL